MCPNGCGTKARTKRVPKHAEILKEPYAVFEKFNADVHGPAMPGEWTPECCGVCGRPKHESMRHHKEHDHVTGLPRGLACFQCNTLMPRLLTLDRARLIVAYLERADNHYRDTGKDDD